MKKSLSILAIGVMLLTSCTGVKTVTKGLESESFIEFIGDPSSYSDGVDVTIDESIEFNAEVNKAKSKRPNGSVYSIAPGKHTITIRYRNEIIYSKQIFVSSQETKQILLR